MDAIKNLPSIIKQLLWLPLALILGFLIAKGGLIIAIGLIVLVVAFYFTAHLYNAPGSAVIISLLIAFFVNGITRYVTKAPLGLTVDLVLVVALVVALFSTQKPSFKQLNSGIFWVSLLWLLFTIVEIVNPEARSKEAWFYAVRAVSLYQIFVVALCLMYFKHMADLKRFVHLTIILIVLSVFWAAKQLYIGLDASEQSWLAEGAYKTHILRGKLRTFSFLSDAGQFGATAAYGGLVSIILALGPFSKKMKIFYLIAGLLCFWGMLMSGTRGALFVPASGVFAYLAATRNIRVILLGLIVVGGLYGFLKYTTIANDNSQIRRLRSGLDPNDPSLQVRLENQRKFKVYLASRPLGGGIGTSGSWGIRFTPGTFLAQTANDSWYVKIWAETGIIGLTLHVGMLLFFIAYGFFTIFKLRDPPLRTFIMALHAGFVGIAFAAYGNPILGQFPLGIILYITWSFFVIAPNIDSTINRQLS